MTNFLEQQDQARMRELQDSRVIQETRQAKAETQALETHEVFKWSFVVAVLVLMVAPATIYRFAATLPDTAPAVDDELIVMAFNNENGYDTDGNFNGHCFAKAVRDTAADFVSVPEGDAMVRKVSSLASVLPC